jgi:hypothetical protein
VGGAAHAVALAEFCVGLKKIMSHLDYLSRKEWKQLGIILLISFLSPSILLLLFYLMLISDAGVEVKAALAAKYIIGVSSVYAASYIAPSFLFIYFKGEKVFKPLIITNFIILLGITILFLLIILFGPHG